MSSEEAKIIDDDKSTASEALSKEFIRSNMAKHLHYAEFSELHRSATLVDIPSDQVYAIRLQTCEAGSKTQCWSCGNQTCKSCTIKMKTLIPESTKHLQHCLPYCTICHFIFLCSRKEKDIETTGRDCDIASHNSHRSPPISTPQPAKAVPVEEERSLCRTCAQLTAEQVIEVFEERELMQTHQMARDLQCHACSRQLYWSKSTGKQPHCWWRCDSCSTTCWWDKHMGIAA
jgi:hypothetical protein